MTAPARALSHNQRAAATLACLPGMHPGRMERLLDRWATASDAWAAVSHHPSEVAHHLVTARTTLSDARALVAQWSTIDSAAVAARCAARDTAVWCGTDAEFPIHEPIPNRPHVLLGEGAQLDALESSGRPRVAIVGTRGATPTGLADTERLAHALATAGCVVVSGLAIGIDGAAHRGAIAAGGTTVAVVATGLDVVYPRRHVALAHQVRTHGGIITESGFGTGPEAPRFPIRNRIIAALADVVVVTEATERGGARITADHAIEYGRTLFALPGSRRNPAAAGCNALIADGANPLLRPSDVLVALGVDAPPDIDAVWDGTVTPPRTDAERRVLAAITDGGASLDELVARSGLDPAALSATLHALQISCAVRAERGRWWPT